MPVGGRVPVPGGTMPVTPVEVRIAALEMQLRELRATECSACGHVQAAHSRVSRPACRQWSHTRPCRCTGFVDP